MNYRRLDYLKRCKIQAFIRAGHTQQQMAGEIGVHKSTICRELNRNLTFVRTRLGYWTYKADYAQKYAEDRQKEKPKHAKASEPIKTFIKMDKLNNRPRKTLDFKTPAMLFLSQANDEKSPVALTG